MKKLQDLVRTFWGGGLRSRLAVLDRLVGLVVRTPGERERLPRHLATHRDSEWRGTSRAGRDQQGCNSELLHVAAGSLSAFLALQHPIQLRFVGCSASWGGPSSGFFDEQKTPPSRASGTARLEKWRIWVWVMAPHTANHCLKSIYHLGRGIHRRAVDSPERWSIPCDPCAPEKYYIYI